MPSFAPVRFLTLAFVSFLSVSAMAQDPGPMQPACKPGQMKERTKFIVFDGRNVVDRLKQRWWRRVDDKTWQEIYPNGYTTTLEVKGPLTLNGVKGILLHKTDDSMQEVFLPSSNSCSYRLFWRRGGAEWRSPSDIIDPAPPSGTEW